MTLPGSTDEGGLYVPAASTNGTALVNRPVGTRGVRWYLPSGATVTYTFSSIPPVAPPTNMVTLTGSSLFAYMDEDLGPGQNIFVVAVTGDVLYRWLPGFD